MTSRHEGSLAFSSSVSPWGLKGISPYVCVCVYIYIERVYNYTYINSIMYQPSKAKAVSESQDWSLRATNDSSVQAHLF